MKFKFYFLIFVLGIGLGFGTQFLFNKTVEGPKCEAGSRKIASVPPNKEDLSLPVKPSKLVRKNIEKTFTTFANLVPWQEVSLTPPEKVTVKDVLVQTGQKVKKGQALVNFDSKLQDYKAELASLELQLKKEEFQLTQRLAKKNFVSKIELHKKKKMMRIQNLRHQIQELSSNSSIKSPIDGIISEINLKLGDFINDPRKHQITIVDNNAFKINLFLPQEVAKTLNRRSIIDIIHEGQKLESTFGNVVSVSPVLDLKTGTISTQIAAMLPPMGWRGGMYVKVLITLASKRGVLTINNEALVKEKGKSFVFKIINKKDKKIVSKVFPVFGINDGRFTEILSGLNENDKVVLKGQGSLGNLAKVKLVK